MRRHVKLVVSLLGLAVILAVGLQYWLRAGEVSPSAYEVGAGSVHVCMASNSVDRIIHLPVLSEFENRGPLTGNLTDEWDPLNPADQGVDDNAALVLTQAVDLTDTKLCAETSARMLVGIDERTVRKWPALPQSKWRFTRVIGYPTALVDQPYNLGAVAAGVLQASLVTGLGEPLETTDLDIAKWQADNPLGQIEADMTSAVQLPRNKHDLNFRICLASSAKELRDGRLVLPPYTVFVSNGHLKGALSDGNITDVFNQGPFVAVATESPVTLSTAFPCAETSARTIVGTSYRYVFPLERVDSKRLFRLVLSKETRDFFDTGSFGLPTQGRVFGTPVMDIGNPLLRRTPPKAALGTGAFWDSPLAEPQTGD
jgi:hypothetical protein